MGKIWNQVVMQTSVDKFSKVETFKGLEKKDRGLEKLFVQLKFNQKKPKYNYQSGITAGMMIHQLMIARPIIESKDRPNYDILKKMFEGIIPLAQILVENYNWKLENLNDLMVQAFGDE